MIPLSFIDPRVLRRFHRYLYFLLKERYFFSKSIWNKLDKGTCKIFIRVDDFPYFDVNNTQFLEFHKIMEDLELPYLLGVTPFFEFEAGKTRELNRDDAEILARCKPLCSVALHGFLHRPYPEFRIQDELDHYSESDISLNMKRAQDKFEELGLEFPTAMIVPFNSINRTTFERLSKYFRYIFTGPTALSTLGGLGLYDRIGDAYNLPSYQPFYGSCSYMEKHLKNPFCRYSKECYIPLTIHWRWEKNDGYAVMRKLLVNLRSKITSFNEVKKWLNSKFPISGVRF